MRQKKKVIGRIGILLSLLLIVGCQRKPVLTKYDAQFLSLFDTVTSITGYTDGKEIFTEYVQEFHDELEKYHQLYDIYHEYPNRNNLKTVNDNAGIQPIKVDSEIIDLILFAKEMNKKTNGKMNIAMGSVLSVWHTYRTEGIADPGQAQLPPRDQLKEAAKHMNIDDIVIDREASTVYLRDPAMSLDVGAVAKGYATEQVCKKLEADGFNHALVSVGGNVRTMGTKGDGSSWKVGIQNPDLNSEEKYLDRVRMKDLSLVSSGSYQRYYTVDGTTYHHIINPDTLMPWNQYLSVSIVCKDSGVADALSTAVFNMEIEDGKQLIENFEDTEAMWVMPDGKKIYSDGFAQHLESD